MSEDRFFSQVRTGLSDYRPEVPASVYEGMRKKLWWSNFTRLSLARFNMWYALLMLGGLGVWVGITNSKSNSDLQVSEAPAQIIQELPTANVSEQHVVSTEVVKQSETPIPTAENKELITSPKAVEAPQVVPSETTEAQSEQVVSSQTQTDVTAPSEVSEELAAPMKQGAKKGMKITTYETGNKKK